MKVNNFEDILSTQVTKSYISWKLYSTVTKSVYGWTQLWRILPQSNPLTCGEINENLTREGNWQLLSVCKCKAGLANYFELSSIGQTKKFVVWAGGKFWWVSYPAIISTHMLWNKWEWPIWTLVKLSRF